MRKSKVVGLSILASILLSYTAHAEEANIKLNDTIVSTKGFETSVREESKNVIVLNQEDIKDKGYTSVSEILKNAPFINSVGSSVGDNSSSIDLRGQGANANNNVKIMINDIPLNVLDLSHSQPPLNSISPSQIERIEIIPGSGSVLYGNGAVGGVVNIITKAEVQKEYGDAQVMYKSYNTKNISGGIGRKVNDKIYFNINFSQDRGNGYRDQDKHFDNNFDSSIAYNLTDSQTVAFLFRTNLSTGTASDGITKAMLDAKRKQAGLAITDYNNTNTDYTLKYDFKINDNLEFKAKAYYQEINKDDNVSGKIDGGRGSLLDIDKWLSDFKEVKQGINLKQQIKHNDGAGNLIVGYDFLDNTLKRDVLTTLDYGRPMPSVFMDVYNDFNKQTHSAFVMEDYTIANKVKLTAGARYEFAKYDIYRYNNLYGMIPLEKKQNKDENNYAYNLGASYIISDTDNVYVNYERGYVSPSPTQLANFLGARGYQDSNLKSQTGNNVEVGYKGYALGSYINATVFYNRNNDEIVTIYANPANPHGAYSYENIDQTQRVGGELFLQQAVSSLTITESATYIDTKVLKGDYKNQKVALVPNTKVTLGADYEVINGLSLGAKMNYNAKYLEKNISNASLDSGKGELTYAKNIFTTDVNVKYEAVNNLNLIAGVDNVFNAKYNLVSDASGTGNYIPANGTTYYVGINYKF